MKPSNSLKENRELIHQVVSAHRASSPRVFGSVLHDRDREGSDLDLLVEPTSETTL